MKAETKITILYANRNRDINRIKNSLDSLLKQKVQNFEVCFVDYGSDEALVHKLKELFTPYEFLKSYFLPASALLWNKSKALNYGIYKAKSEFIFIADVDIIFHPEATSLFHRHLDPKSFFLFRMGYLPKGFSYDKEELKSRYLGNVNGMILASTEAFLRINGLDEFFHFYGGEDEDLFNRMENSSLMRKTLDEPYFFHQWHEGYMSKKQRKRKVQPNLSYAMRLNSEHLDYNKRNKITSVPNLIPDALERQINSSQNLNDQGKHFSIKNRRSELEHFLNFELKHYEGELISVEFSMDPYHESLKYKIKKRLGKESRQWLGFRELNDMILSKIIHDFRDKSYSYKLSEDDISIHFKIQL